MLHELRVENLLLMERAQLRLAPGLNMLTGETGAGKTLLAHALDLLLGGRARRGIVRAGSDEAYVEGVFELPPELAGDDRLPAGAQELVLARRVWPDGRTRAYVCGRAATLSDLQELGNRMLSFYGQHEHRRLMLSTAQLELLDAYCGPGQAELRTALRAGHERARELEAEVAHYSELAGARDRESDLLSFELAEIETAAPTEAEKGALMLARDRLRHREALVHAAAGAARCVRGGGDHLGGDAGDGGAVCELLATATVRLSSVAELDPGLADLARRLDALRYEAEDVAGDLAAWLAQLDQGAPDAEGSLEEIEARLALVARLERKHGGTVADVLAYAERCRLRLAQLDDADGALGLAQTQLAEALRERDRLAARLAAARAAAAPRLAAAVRERLAELAMDAARFELELTPRAEGCGPRGADSLEMLIAANPGGPLGPLREVASGGELSRVMLALLSVAHADDEARGDALLVFDEIDTGIGGHTARAVGEHLRRLAAGRQLLCITHLPQVAALADRHFTIVKDGSGKAATTMVTELRGDDVVAELVRMLGGGAQDRAAGEHARELLRTA
ncbi:MAG: DNA repair protein RecN [Solirubrobacteraceae bacterium]